MAKVVKLNKYAQASKAAKAAKAAGRTAGKSSARTNGNGARDPGAKDIDHFIKTSGLDTRREKEIGQHIGYRYDVNLVPDYAGSRLSSRNTWKSWAGRTSTGWRMCTWATRKAEPPSSTATSTAGSPCRKRCASGQSAGPRHAGARALDQIPDVHAPSHGRSEQGLSQVLSAAPGRDVGRWHQRSASGSRR